MKAFWKLIFVSSVLILELIFITHAGFAKEMKGYPFNVEKRKDEFRCLATKEDYAVGTNSIGGQEKQALLYEVCIDPQFSEGAENILRQSFHRFVKEIFQPAVLHCARPSTIKMTEEVFLRDVIIEPLRIRSFDKDVFTAGRIFISPLQEDDSNLYAFGYPRFYDNPQMETGPDHWRKHISIAVREDLIAANSFGLGNDIEFWSSMIAISFLSNMGILEDFQTSTELSFPDALARCILWEGKIPAAFQEQHLQPQASSTASSTEGQK